MEAPTWTINDLTEEDLAKLPAQLREMTLLNLPIDQLLRINKNTKITIPLRQVLDDIRFWIQRMTNDGFILPINTVEFAEKWRKKNQTAAQFLSSFYYGYKTAAIDIISFTDELNLRLQHFQKYNHRQEIYQQMKILLELVEAEQKDLLKLDYEITALFFSADIFIKRYPRLKIINFELPAFENNFSFEQGSLSDFFDILGKTHLHVLTNFNIPDPVGLIKDARNMKKRVADVRNKRSKCKEDYYSTTGSLASANTDQTEIIRQMNYMSYKYGFFEGIDIQAPGYENVKTKVLQYFELVAKLAHEGDVLVSHNINYYIYKIGDMLHVKRFHKSLPEEALPFLIREKLSTDKQIRNNYGVSAIEIQGRLVTLSDHTDRILLVNGHKFYVTVFRLTPGITTELRCRWLTSSDGKYPFRCIRDAVKNQTNDYFCLVHASDPNVKEQILRCQIEDGNSIENGEKVVLLEDFPIISADTSHGERQYQLPGFNN